MARIYDDGIKDWEDELKDDVEISFALTCMENQFEIKYSLVYLVKDEYFIKEQPIVSVIEMMRAVCRAAVKERFDGNSALFFNKDEQVETRRADEAITCGQYVKLSGTAICMPNKTPKKPKKKLDKEWCGWHHGYSYDDERGACSCCGGPRDYEPRESPRESWPPLSPSASTTRVSPTASPSPEPLEEA